MAGEFKEYDKLFDSNRGLTFENIQRTHGKVATEDWMPKKSWYDFMPTWEYNIHGRTEITDAVYRAKGAREWQFFRVGLHGLETNAKLYCLAWYYAHPQIPNETAWMRKIRVDNYLGALIRGGQLNDKLEIKS